MYDGFYLRARAATRTLDHRLHLSQHSKSEDLERVARGLRLGKQREKRKGGYGVTTASAFLDLTGNQLHGIEVNTRQTGFFNVSFISLKTTRD